MQSKMMVGGVFIAKFAVRFRICFLQKVVSTNGLNYATLACLLDIQVGLKREVTLGMLTIMALFLHDKLTTGSKDEKKQLIESLANVNRVFYLHVYVDIAIII